MSCHFMSLYWIRVFFLNFSPIGEKDLLNRCITLQSFFVHMGKQKVFFVIILLT